MPAVAAATCPPAVVFNNTPEASEETQRFVLDAVVAVTIVVLAKGMERPTVDGAAKLMVSAEPTSAPEPEREIAVPASGEEVATL